MNSKEQVRQSSTGETGDKQRGVLLPVFSLPSKTGIGCFSKEAYAFVDFLKAAGQDAWQILPLGPIDQWFSPYQPCSVYAGEPLFIDPEKLAEDGLLTRQELEDFSREHGSAPCRVDYTSLIPAKAKLLRQAYSRAVSSHRDASQGAAGEADHTHIAGHQDEYLHAFDLFKTENQEWLDDYCLFMALRKHHDGKPWTGWEAGCAAHDPQALERARQTLAGDIDYYAWQQYEFFRQWQALHDYAGEQGIRIIGDMPFYMTLDSVECWKDPGLFQLDEKHHPLFISGVPGDRFNRRGQVWNSPVYNWSGEQGALLDWWRKRIRRSFDFHDMIRLDHVRAFCAYYAIPSEKPQARYGSWRPGPGAAVFEPFREEIAQGRLIAEDLGIITEDVRRMMREAKLPGMAVLQFAFDSGRKNPYRPENIRPDTVVYTGTHDNDTIAGWYESLGWFRRRRVERYFKRVLQDDSAGRPREADLDTRAALITKALIKTALRSPGRLAVIPLQDYLGLGSEARINAPGTTEGNWSWRVDASLLTRETAQSIKGEVQ